MSTQAEYATQPTHRAQSGHLSPAPEPDAAPGRPRYSAVLITAGHVKAADGTDTNWLVPAHVLERDAHRFEGVPCYLDHPELFGFGFRGEPQVKNLFGIVTSAFWSEPDQAVMGNLTLYDQDPNSPGAFVRHLLAQILDDQDAGQPVPPLGLSAVFFQEATLDEDTGAKVTTSFKQVESVDLVYSPGAGGYIKQALAAIPHTGATPERQRLELAERQRLELAERRNRPMTEKPTEYVAETSAGEVNNAIATLASQVGQLQAQVEHIHQDLEAGPPAAEEHPSLEDLHDQVAQLSQLVAGQEAERTVEGMGHAPTDIRARLSVADPTDELQNAWDWIFGAPDAVTPKPELRRTDYLYRLMSGDLNWSGVFDGREALAAANTTTLSDMAVNAMNKVIVPLYNRLTVYRWYEEIVSVQPTDGSLHDMAWLQFGGIGDLPVVAEGAAYTELTVGDTKETDAFTKYGGYVGITDKMLRNSDIARIQAVPRAMTVAAVQTRSAKIAALFSANSGVGPTLDQDSKALFHADHSNLATTAFSWTAWQAARIQCAKHAEITSSKRTGFFPKYCLVPVDLYDTALQIFGYGQGTGGQPGTANNDVNPYGVGREGDPRPVPVMVPDWTDANDWAYLVDPIIAPVVMMAYADNPSGRGHPAPQLYSVTSPTAGLMFTNDVLPIKVRDYWAYGVATYRGIGKRNVT